MTYVFAQEVCLLCTWALSRQAQKKEFTQVQTKEEKKEENSSAWLSPFFYSHRLVLLPHTSRLHYLAPLSVIWHVISMYKFLFRIRL